MIDKDMECEGSIGSTGVCHMSPATIYTRDIPEDESSGWLQQQADIRFNEDRMYAAERHLNDIYTLRYIVCILICVIVIMYMALMFIL